MSAPLLPEKSPIQPFAQSSAAPPKVCCPQDLATPL